MTLLFLTILVLGLALIHCLRFLHTVAERQVIIKQSTMTAFFDRREGKMNYFHNAVIIAKRELLVKRKPHILGLVKINT